MITRTRISPEIKELVDEPLLAENCRVGLACSPQIADRMFVGLTFEDPEGVRGDVVLTVELAEALAGLLNEAVAKARRAQARAQEVSATDARRVKH